MSFVLPILNAVAGSLAGPLASEIAKKYGLLEDDVTSLQTKKSTIEMILADLDEKKRQDENFKEWHNRLVSATLEADNVLDAILTEELLRKLSIEKGFFNALGRYVSTAPDLIYTKLDVQRVLKQLNDVVNDKLVAMLSQSQDPKIVDENSSNETASDVDLSTIHGRFSDVTTLVNQKIRNKDIGRRRDTGDVRVFAIWGMGGVGKTTLAQQINKHERVVDYFDKRVWVDVSRNFNLKNIIKTIIESIDTERKCTLEGLDALMRHLEEQLIRNKFKFLIILDDVWVDEPGVWKEWNRLRTILKNKPEESIVLLTTRNKSTIEMMDIHSELQLNVERLSDDDGRSLFKKFAFPHEMKEEDKRKLEPMANEIADKCKGLPIALTTLGSSMKRKCTPDEWQTVLESKIWDMPERKDFLPSLMISFDNLSKHLKLCFAFCCFFPYGHKMYEDTLIELWIVNGLIPPRGEVDLFKLGKEAYKSLVQRSLFQRVEWRYQDSWSMHDLMHDLARHVMGHFLDVGPKKMEITQNEPIHLSSSCVEFLSKDKDVEKLRSVRSLFIFNDNREEVSFEQITNIVHLRVLYVEQVPAMKTLPESILKLKHLRYLNLRGSNINSLPDSIMYLQNLQVLILAFCSNLLKLPDGLCYMRKLQYLDTEWCNKLEYMPVGMKQLAGLRRLPYFVVGKEKGARLEELGDLNINGSLTLGRLYNVKDSAEAKSAKLSAKTNLTSLTLDYCRIYDRESPRPAEHDEKVLEGMEPNSDLKKLVMASYNGKIAPKWMVNLTNLVNIYFSDCQNCLLPPLGRLPNLEYLHISEMRTKVFHDDDLKVTDSILFPRLEKLSIWGCCLDSFPSKFPELETLSILGCFSLTSLCCNVPKLKKLSIRACDHFKSLPDGPDSLRELTDLDIFGDCPLKRECENEVGDEWSKIRHANKVLNNRGANFLEEWFKNA